MVKNLKKYEFDSKFYEIADKIAQQGGRMYLVGGAVRDLFLGKKPHDMDFCVTGLSAEEFNNLFDVPRVQGKAFPVFIMNGCEFALARKEKKIGEKHTDFEVQTDKSITIEEDLARRDLTINSMALDVLSGEFVDPFHGMEDIKKGVIRMTTEAYKEDPLRVYRTARFAAKFGFDVDEATLKMMESMKGELSNLSAERVCAEFRKALLTDSPSKFFDTLKKANILDVHFPEIANLVGVLQPVEYHPEGDAYTHTMQVLDEVSRRTQNTSRLDEATLRLSMGIYPDERKFTSQEQIALTSRVSQKELIRFCALVHDLGKGVTPREEWPHHYNHEENGVPVIKSFCKRIKMPKVFEKAGILTSKLHMKFGKFDSIKPSTIVNLIEEMERSRSLSYEGMEIIASCDSKKNIQFADIARKIMNIGVTTEIKEKCTTNGIFDYEKAKNIVHSKRVDFMREALNRGDTSIGEFENGLAHNLKKDIK